MKTALLSLLLVTPGLVQASEALTANDWLGTWATPAQGQCCGKAKIEFRQDGSAVLTREFSKGETQVHAAPSKQVAHIQDIVLITFDEGSEVRYKLVLSGWKLPSPKMIFGTLYLYTNGAVYNGIPITFQRP